mgnify:FL=1
MIFNIFTTNLYISGRRMLKNKFDRVYYFSLIFSLALLSGCASTPDSGKVTKPVYPSPPEQPRFHFQETIISSADVESEDKESAFKRMITGQTRSGIGLGKPFGVTAWNGRIYVSDTVKRQVTVFDKKNGKYSEIGTETPGELFKPLGLDVDNQGNLYVCDSLMKHVVVFDSDGKYLRTIGERKLFSRPAGLTVNPEGTKVFVVDTGGVNSDWHRIVVFDAQSGEFLYNISKRGNEDGELNLPREATISSDGNLYVVDGGNFRIQVFSQEGEFLHKFGDIGRRSGQFSRPKGIGSDKDGNLYVADAAFGNFQIFNPNGDLLLAVGTRNSAFGPGNFMLPSGLAVDEDGRVFMVDQYFQKIDVFRPAAIEEKQGLFAFDKSTIK